MSGRSLNVKPPAYARTVLARRSAGWLPWLVVVAVGAVCDWATLPGHAGVARIGLPPKFPLARGDWRCLRGLDVLLSPVEHMGWTAEHQAKRYETARAAIWASGEPATLWELEDGFAFRVLCMEAAGGWQFERLTIGFEVTSAEFEPGVQRARDAALLRGDGFFARPEFLPDRSALAQRLLG